MTIPDLSPAEWRILVLDILWALLKPAILPVAAVAAVWLLRKLARSLQARFEARMRGRFARKRAENQEKA